MILTITFPQYFTFYSQTIAAIFAIISGIYNWKFMDLPGKLCFAGVVWFFIVNTLCSCAFIYSSFESLCPPFFLIADEIHPIGDYSLMMLFFNYSAKGFRKYHVGYFLIALGIIVCIITAIIYRDTPNFNVYFIPFVSIVVVITALVLLYIMQKEAPISTLLKNPVFWFATLFLFSEGLDIFWEISFDLLMKYTTSRKIWMFLVPRITDIFFVGTGIIFFLYRKNAKTI